MYFIITRYRRQEELRRQLAEIQEQKRKLLTASSERELYDTQSSLRSAFSRLGVELEQEESSAQSTPTAASSRPPVTLKPGLTDYHELSVIAELDTPTHITELEEHASTTLMQSILQQHNDTSTDQSQSR